MTLIRIESGAPIIVFKTIDSFEDWRSGNTTLDRQFPTVYTSVGGIYRVEDRILNEYCYRLYYPRSRPHPTRGFTMAAWAVNVKHSMEYSTTRI